MVREQMMSDGLLPKGYTFHELEPHWYDFWVKQGFFQAKVESPEPPYSIVIPPPNVTGQLHMGHALNNTLQDILCRYKRLKGFEVLWVPGTDHAGIATQNVVERQLSARRALPDTNWAGKHSWSGSGSGGKSTAGSSSIS